ncbi:hypothetical protein CLOSTHATH_07570, partial [Hungatella hathewayi DSM 13479]
SGVLDIIFNISTVLCVVLFSFMVCLRSYSFSIPPCGFKRQYELLSYEVFVSVYKNIT